jgi:RNA polymerase primary sigma factor
MDLNALSGLSQRIEDVLNTLTPQEQKILRMRFGLGVSTPHTLEEVAQDFGAARERIREIEQRALRKLRCPVRSD